MKIKTNNQPRELVGLIDIPERFRADFDYITGDDTYSMRLVKYKGQYYDTNEFMPVPKQANPIDPQDQMQAWHGYQSDTYFSGTLIKFASFDTVIIATYYS
jgi:hypothetical protein